MRLCVAPNPFNLADKAKRLGISVLDHRKYGA
jgi:hypothetical protein